MPRGLDHLVHLVRDLDAAGELYDLLGFTVGPRNHHPWGTHNRIVQLPGFFIELLEVAEPAKIPEHTDRQFSFGAFNRDFLARNGQGFSMLALEGTDPQGDRDAFAAAGYGDVEVFDFSRNARRPDGQDVEVGFSLAFAMEPDAPNAAFFTVKQLRPENFWIPDMQRHANGATGVAGIVLVAEQPADHTGFVQALCGIAPRRATDDWYVTQTPRGDIDIMTRAVFAERFGGPPPAGDDLRIGAVRFVSPGTDSMRRGLAARRMIEEKIAGLVVVPPNAAMGGVLVFDRPA